MALLKSRACLRRPIQLPSLFFGSRVSYLYPFPRTPVPGREHAIADVQIQCPRPLLLLVQMAEFLDEFESKLVCFVLHVHWIDKTI